jgi:hypothetical protein
MVELWISNGFVVIYDGHTLLRTDSLYKDSVCKESLCNEDKSK